MTAPVFLFGLGATKAGTSWLYRYLLAHPECAMPVQKELHYFDRAEEGALDAELARVSDRQAALGRALAAAPPARRAALRREIGATARWAEVLSRGQLDERAYCGYLTHGAAGRRVVGDVTPAYALLSPAMLERMQQMVPQTRFVYLLRDPVDRLWSHLRMVAGRGGATGEALRVAAAAAFDGWAAGGHRDVADRGDYAAILAKLDRAIRPGALFTAFYERLFDTATLARLCGFLGIAARPGDTAARVHAGAEAPLDPARAARARAILAPQYDAVAARFGDLPERWTQTMRWAA